MTCWSIGSPAVWSSRTAWKLGTRSGRLSVAGLPASRFSDALVGSDVLGVLVGELLEVLLAVSDGLGVAAEQGGDIVEAAMAELGRLDGGVAAPVVLAERAVEDLHGAFDIRRIGKGNGHGFGPPSQGIWHIPYHPYKQSRFREVNSASILNVLLVATLRRISAGHSSRRVPLEAPVPETLARLPLAEAVLTLWR